MINFSKQPILITLSHIFINKCLGIFLLVLIACCLFSTISFAQQKITGIVTGTDNLPLAGATVTNKKINISVITNTDGFYTTSANKGDELVFSFAGYKSRQIEIGNDVLLNVSLVELIINLDEIVVTGYTTQKVKEITGSVSIVKPKDLVSVPAGQVEQMLQGRVAGLNVITSGQPGSASNVRLHGIGNFGDVTPLYIIDGVQGDINNLNPNDIESLQVLKDAGAYAIYGIRGANGVIIITTRSGKNGKTKISYDSYISTTRPLKNGPDLLDPQGVADLRWLALKNSGQLGSNGNPFDPLYGNGPTPVLPDYFIPDMGIGLMANDPRANPDLYNIDFSNGPIYQIIKSNKEGTDWFHESYKPAFSQNHSLTVSGANEKNKYLFSIGHLNQQGTFLNTYLKRYTVRINTEFSLNKHIRIGENLQLAYRDNPQAAQQTGNGGDIASSVLASPLSPVYDIKGGWAHLELRSYFNNTVAMRALAKDNKANYWEIFGNAFAEADFLKFFTLRTNFGGSLVNYYSYNFFTASYFPQTNGLPNNNLRETSGYRRSWTWTNTLKFSGTLGNDHSINALAGIEAIDNYNREVGGLRSGFFINDLNYRFLSNGDPASQSNYSYAGTSTLFSFISQADYAFKKKLFLKGTLRNDGSSVFGPLHRYGWFPSVSAAWRITEEKILKASDWLTDLKIRASWGKTGFYGNTDPLNQFNLYGGTAGDAYYDINGTSNSPVQGFRAVRSGDPRTGWQEDIVTNIGFESVFWNGMLSITVDKYKKKAKGLLFPITLPAILGGAIPPNGNIGEVQNTGFDILLNSKRRFSRDWNLDATLTLTTYKNKILRLTDLRYFFPSNTQSVGFVKNEVGHPASSFYTYKIIGLFQNQEDVNKSPVQDAAAPGRFKYLDADGDGRITDEDRVFIGNANPKFTAGINIGINYKNFDFSTFCYGSFGNDVMNLIDVEATIEGKSKKALYDSWSPQHQNGSTPIPETYINFSTWGPPNSFALEKGSYFRNRSMILGYTFSNSTLQRMKMEKMRIYVQAVNLFTITKYSGLDPELSGTSAAYGLDLANYPNNQKQYLLGISIGL